MVSEELQNAIIDENLNKINNELNLDLKLCNYFTGLRELNEGEYYFNVLLDNEIATKEYNELIERIESLNFISKVEPNGVTRVAITIK